MSCAVRSLLPYPYAVCALSHIKVGLIPLHCVKQIIGGGSRSNVGATK